MPVIKSEILAMELEEVITSIELIENGEYSVKELKNRLAYMVEEWNIEVEHVRVDFEEMLAEMKLSGKIFDIFADDLTLTKVLDFLSEYVESGSIDPNIAKAFLLMAKHEIEGLQNLYRGLADVAYG